MGFLEHPPDQRWVSSLSNAVHLQHFVCLSPSWLPAALNALMLLPGPIIIINACPVIINKVHPPRIRERQRTRKTAISWHCVKPGQAGKTRQGLIGKPGKPCKQLLPLLPLLLLLPDPVWLAPFCVCSWPITGSSCFRQTLLIFSFSHFSCTA